MVDDPTGGEKVNGTGSAGVSVSLESLIPKSLLPVTGENISSIYIPSSGAKRRKPTSHEAADRLQIAGCIEEATKQVEAMLLGATNDDPIGLAVAGFDLKESLQKLWDLRAIREAEFSDLINHLQICLARLNFEEFSVTDCTTLRMVLKNYLARGAVDREDVRDAIQMLSDAGFEPWSALAVCKDPDEE